MRASFWIRPTVLLAIAAPVLADGGAQHQVKQSPPVKMGTSGGSVADHSSLYCCGGTLGCLVQRDGVLSILSNNHILARSGSAATGEDTLQPGLIDSNCSGTTSNIVGDFAGNLVPLGSANVDVGLSTARANVDSSGSILDIGVPCTTVQAPTIGLAVMKSGRTTGFTTGSITSINTTVTVQYQKGCNQGKRFNVTFTNQIVTGAMSSGGDSGSLLLSNDGSANPVGLLFAGSASATVYNRAQDVVNAFSAGGHTFSFVGVSCATTEDRGNVDETPSEREIEAAMRVQSENEFDLFRNPNVLGVGIGAAEDNPLEAVLVLYVESTNEHPFRTLPTEIDGVRVRVILTDRIVAQ